MMNNNKKEEGSKKLFNDEFTVASATECTGLIPSSPETESQVDSYSEIYDIPLADSYKHGKRNQTSKNNPAK